MRLRLLAATVSSNMQKKLYFISFLTLFFIVIEYHVSNTWSISPVQSVVPDNQKSDTKLLLQQVNGTVYVQQIPTRRPNTTSFAKIIRRANFQDSNETISNGRKLTELSMTDRRRSPIDHIVTATDVNPLPPLAGNVHKLFQKPVNRSHVLRNNPEEQDQKQFANDNKILRSLNNQMKSNERVKTDWMQRAATPLSTSLSGAGKKSQMRHSRTTTLPLSNGAKSSPVLHQMDSNYSVDVLADDSTNKLLNEKQSNQLTDWDEFMRNMNNGGRYLIENFDERKGPPVGPNRTISPLISNDKKNQMHHQTMSAPNFGKIDYSTKVSSNGTMIDSAVSKIGGNGSMTEYTAKKMIENIKFSQTITNTIGNARAKSIALQIAMEILSNPHYLHSMNQVKHHSMMQQSPSISKPMIYVITPTYKRPEQIAELTRLAQTLMHVDNLCWLVIEDAENKSAHISALLRKTNMKYHHLIAAMPEIYRHTNAGKPKGVSNRNRGIKWIREHVKEGVMYFADDDNTYDIDLFNEMRYTKKVSMWPVGLCSSTMLSTPIIKNGRIIGFYDGWQAGRKYPVDMAGFAINIKFLHERPEAKMPFRPGFEEDGFLRSLDPFEPHEIEPKAYNCTRILVWHTQTRKYNPYPQINPKKYANTNLEKLREVLS